MQKESVAAHEHRPFRRLDGERYVKWGMPRRREGSDPWRQRGGFEIRILIGAPPALGIPQQLFDAGDLPDQLSGRAAVSDVRIERREGCWLRIVRGRQDFVEPSRPLPILGREEN